MPCLAGRLTWEEGFDATGAVRCTPSPRAVMSDPRNTRDAYSVFRGRTAADGQVPCDRIRARLGKAIIADDLDAPWDYPAPGRSSRSCISLAWLWRLRELNVLSVKCVAVGTQHP